ncbi:MAG: PilZ domain-containing protein [Candidatus Omnitrophica bacterium]|nr:PilZ domain-containing protein [Candidatus Omnitrophota bacterium]
MNRVYETDRRRFQRLKVNLSVFYRLFEAPWDICQEVGTQEFEGSALDLSELGMGIACQHSFPADVRLKISFILSRCDDEGIISFKDPVEVKARVCYCLPNDNGQFRLGVSFLEITTKERYSLASFIYSTRSPKTFI